MFISRLPLKKDVDAFIGDEDTGVVHRSDAWCANRDGVLFLDVRTALVRGYEICSCCAIERGVLAA